MEQTREPRNNRPTYMWTIVNARREHLRMKREKRKENG